MTCTRATYLTLTIWSICKQITSKCALFHPHCTHVLQPQDDLPYTILKRKYQKELLPFNLRVAGEKLSKQQFFQVLVPTFTSAFQPEIIRRGFLNTGIYPLNQEVPKLQQLGPSEVYNKCRSNDVNCYLHVHSDLSDIGYCHAIKMKGMVFRYMWVYSKEDTMAHIYRAVVTS